MAPRPATRHTSFPSAWGFTPLVVGLLTVGSTFLVCHTAEAARRIAPPSQTLLEEQNHLAEVVALTSTKEAVGRFHIVEILPGRDEAEGDEAARRQEETRETGRATHEPSLSARIEDHPAPPGSTLEVRLDPAVAAEVTPGRHYLLAYTNLRRHPLLRDVLEIDPQGSRAVRLPLAGEALFGESAALGELLEEARAEDPKPSLAPVFALLDGPPSRLRRLAIFELFANDALHAQLDTAARQRLAKRFRSSDLADDERDFLLKTFLLLPTDRRAPATVLAREVLRSNGAARPVVFDLDSGTPALVLTAVLVLTQDATTGDVGLLAPYLLANNPAVARGAFDLMARLDEAAARRHAQTALADPALLGDVERYLESRLARAPSTPPAGPRDDRSQEPPASPPPGPQAPREAPVVLRPASSPNVP